MELIMRCQHKTLTFGVIAEIGRVAMEGVAVQL